MATILSPAEMKVMDTAGAHLRWEDSLALASVSLLLFEYSITFSEEVEYIWSKPKSLVGILYTINRYFGPVGITICMVALFDRNITEKSCVHIAPFEGVFTLVTVLVAEAILIIRVYALHQNSKFVLALHTSLWIMQTCMMSFNLAHSGPVVIPTTAITFGCVLVADSSIGILSVVLWTIPSLIFDTATFLLLVAGAWRRSDCRGFSILRLIVRDGTLYFGAIVGSNVLWTVTGFVLTSDLKNIWAFMSTVMTSILISRITLNLRSHDFMTHRLIMPIEQKVHSDHFQGSAGSGSKIAAESHEMIARCPL